MEELAIVIANNIRDLRKSHGFTQADLAERLGYTVQAISRWEKGKSLPDPIMMHRLGEIFSVDIDYFYHQNHIQITPEQHKSIARREALFRIALILVSMFVVGLLIATIVFLIDSNVVDIVLWVLSFVTLSVLALGIYLKNRRIINIFIPAMIVTVTTALYFTLHSYVPNIKFAFIPMVAVLVLYFVFLFFTNWKK